MAHEAVFLGAMATLKSGASALLPLLADSSLVLEPDFDRLVLGVLGKLRRDCRGEVFLNAAWASSLACGWRGRTESRR